MPPKKKPTPVEWEDALTFLRMELPVEELQHLSATGRDTPVSGDALKVYSSNLKE